MCGRGRQREGWSKRNKIYEIVREKRNRLIEGTERERRERERERESDRVREGVSE